MDVPTLAPAKSQIDPPMARIQKPKLRPYKPRPASQFADANCPGGRGILAHFEKTMN
jgi:hypothetical protein